MGPAYEGTEEYRVMPADVTEIPEGAFAGDRSLRSIDLRNVRRVGASAFQECVNLESVIMSKVSVIGPGAFEFCRSLRDIRFGDVKEIGRNAFFSCSMLDIPEIPRTLERLGEGAFSHTAVRRADLHRFSEVPRSLFSYCASLSYADVSGAKVIGDDAFASCGSLTKVSFGPLEKIGDRAFTKCDSLVMTALPDSLLYIGDDALSNVTGGIIVPEGVRHIGRNCLGPADRRKSIRIYRSALYEFRNYFGAEKKVTEDEDEHFHLWESSIDVRVLDERTGEVTGFLPLYSDLDSSLREALKAAFRPDNTFDYSVLDRTLFPGMGWNQRCKDRLAVMRSKHPFGLSEEARSAYHDYFSKHLARISRRAVRDRDIDMLAFLCDNGLIAADNINGLIDHSVSLSAPECTAFLLERQSEMDCGGHALLEEL